MKASALKGIKIDPASKDGQQVLQLLETLNLVPAGTAKAEQDEARKVKQQGELGSVVADILSSIRLARKNMEAKMAEDLATETRADWAGEADENAPHSTAELSYGEQVKVLKAFSNREDSRFKVGDEVVRNTFGLEKYIHPIEGHAAVVISVFASSKLDNDGQVIHGEIGLTCPGGHVHTHAVDFRYYRLVSARDAD